MNDSGHMPGVPTEGQLARLEQDLAFQAMVRELAAVFYESTAAENAVREIRSWVARQFPPSDAVRLGDAAVELASSLALPVAVRPRIAVDGSNPAQTRRDFRRAVQHGYPFPVASAYQRAISSEQDPAARYGALLDTFEILLILLAHLQLSEYLAGERADRTLNNDLLALLIDKPNLSTGDWAQLLFKTAAACQRVGHAWFFPELAGFLFAPNGRRTAAAEIFVSFVQRRNRAWGHRLGRSTEYYEQCLAADLPLLDEMLGAMSFLEGTLMVVPTRLSSRGVVEGRIYEGIFEPQIDEITIPLPPSERVENGGLIIVNRSLLLYGRRTERHRTLFPFVYYRDAADRLKRGLQVLVRMKWDTRGQHHRLARTLYSPQRPDVAGAEPEDDVEMHETVQRLLLALRSVNHPDPEACGGTAVRSDSDWSIPTVWADRKQKLRLFTGRQTASKRIEEMIASLPGGGLIIVHGCEGIGKSSFLYHLSEALQHRHPLLHSISRNAVAESFLRALIYQCSQHLDRPLGDSAYTGPDVDDLRVSLERSMAALATEKPGGCVAIIDALDELPTVNDDWESVLEWLPRVYPDGVYVIVSCQPVPRLLNVLYSIARHRRREYEMQPLEAADLMGFVGNLERESSGGDISRVIDLQKALECSGGHPLFLRNIVEEAFAEVRTADEQGREPHQIDLDTFCKDEQAQLMSVWERLSGRTSHAPRAEQELRRRLIHYISIASEPGLSITLLRALLEQTAGRPLDHDYVADLLLSINQYLKEILPGRYLPYHRRFAEFVVRRVMDARDGALRHGELARLLIASGAAYDPVYWRKHVTMHAAQAGLSDAETAPLLHDDKLIAGRLADGMGRIHGTWICRCFQDAPAERREDFARGLLDRWVPAGRLRAGLTQEGEEELAELLIAAALPGFHHAAKQAYERLYDRSGDGSYLWKKARICYQFLDEWNVARQSLGECIERFEAGGQEFEAARARAVLAGILFDTGVQEPAPETILRERCLPVFQRLGQTLDEAAVCETLGIVVDAESRWGEALQFYTQAMVVYERAGDDLSIGRLHMNRAVARLFTEGTAAATQEMEASHACHTAYGSRQLTHYWAVNENLIELLTYCQDRRANLRGALVLDEQWLRLTYQETEAIRRWFNGDIRGALQDLLELAAEFEALEDAWGSLDSRLNAGFLCLVAGRAAEAEGYFAAAYDESDALERFSFEFA